MTLSRRGSIVTTMWTGIPVFASCHASSKPADAPTPIVASTVNRIDFFIISLPDASTKFHFMLHILDADNDPREPAFFPNGPGLRRLRAPGSLSGDEFVRMIRTARSIYSVRNALCVDTR